MLQISTGKFYESGDPEQLHITLHRGVLYTNYNFLPERIVTKVGDLVSAAGWGDLQTVVSEVTERLPNPGGQMIAGSLVSVGRDVMINDFAALVSFRLNVTCSPDPDLVRRLVVGQRPPLGIFALPRDYVPRMFDSSLPYRTEEVVGLEGFISELMGLKRSAYSGVMRAIRRYVTAMYRLSDDLDLSYALLVASIESLAQEFDQFSPAWEDLAPDKRGILDRALVDSPSEVGDSVREAVLRLEHVALKRRFCEFCNQFIEPAYFRNEAEGRPRPIGRTALNTALKNAYDLRSGYIHTLRTLPRHLTLSPTHADCQLIDSRPYFTFSGLSRLARHVILEFIRQSTKVEREAFDYASEYPNIVRAPLDPRYWIHDARQYTPKTARLFLNGLLTQIAGSYVSPAQKVTDLRQVLEKIESLVPSLAKSAQRIPMLALYFLFSGYMSDEYRGRRESFLQTYEDDFDKPSIESLLVHFLVGKQKPAWPLETTDDLLAEYISQRFRKGSVNAGPMIGAAISLWVAELYREAGNDERARELVAQAVEEYPEQQSLRSFESALEGENVPAIEPWDILLPKELQGC